MGRYRKQGKINMTRALTKHVARRQDQTFADWFAELKDLAGERPRAVQNRNDEPRLTTCAAS